MGTPNVDSFTAFGASWTRAADGLRTGQQQRGALGRGIRRLQTQPVTAGEKTCEIKGHRLHGGMRSPAGDLPERSRAPWSHQDPPGAAAGSSSPTSTHGERHSSRSPGCRASLVPPRLPPSASQRGLGVQTKPLIVPQTRENARGTGGDASCWLQVPTRRRGDGSPRAPPAPGHCSCLLASTASLCLHG